MTTVGMVRKWTVGSWSYSKPSSDTYSAFRATIAAPTVALRTVIFYVHFPFLKKKKSLTHYNRKCVGIKVRWRMAHEEKRVSRWFTHERFPLLAYLSQVVTFTFRVQRVTCHPYYILTHGFPYWSRGRESYVTFFLSFRKMEHKRERERRLIDKAFIFFFFVFSWCRCDVAVDQFRRDRVHRMLGRSPRDGRPRFTHPVSFGTYKVVNLYVVKLFSCFVRKKNTFT